MLLATRRCQPYPQLQELEVPFLLLGLKEAASYKSHSIEVLCRMQGAPSLYLCFAHSCR